MLRDTSILPDIPGLPGLVMMLFTPVMELRYDIFTATATSRVKLFTFLLSKMCTFLFSPYF